MNVSRATGLRVLVVTGANRAMTGAPRSLLMLTQSLEEIGLVPTLSAVRGAAIAQHAKEMGLRVVFTGAARPDAPVRRRPSFRRRVAGVVIRLPWGALALADTIRREKPDVVIVRGVAAAITAGVAARGRRTPLIWDVGIEPQHGWASRLAKRIGLALATRVVVQSSSVGSSIFEGIADRRWRGKTVSIVPGVAPDRAQALLAVAPYKPGTNGPLLCLGSIHPRKNQMLLLRALWRMQSSTGAPSVWFVGSVEDAAYERKLLRFTDEYGLNGAVRWLGWRDDVVELLESARAVVLCSEREGVPHAIREAAMASRMVVATRVGGVPDVVSDGTTGLIIAPGNEEQLVEALFSTWDEERCRTMGIQAREKARGQFSRARWIQRYGELVQEVHASAQQSQ